MNESFGIKKIVDCKITDDGKQMFKVKWEPTWEPAENLSSCQHLIDEFWSFVNKSKSKEEMAVQYEKNLYRNMNSVNKEILDNKQFALTEDSKTQISRLIERTSSTPVGNNLLYNQNHMIQNYNQTQNPSNTSHTHNENSYFDTNRDSIKRENDIKLPTSNSQPKTKMSTGNAAALKYIENFSNQYVKIILVCKICNKEQSLKFSHNWKKHYLSHVSNEEKPHKCPHCPKAFVTAPQVKNHIKTHLKSMVVKEEFLPL